MTDSLLKRKCGLCTDIKHCNFDGCIDDLNEQFKQDKEVCDAATAGPWIPLLNLSDELIESEVGLLQPGEITALIGGRSFASEKDFDRIESNMRFISEARTRWPAALDRIEELEAENAKLREALQKIAEYKDPWHSAHHEAGIDPVQVRIAREALKE